jgi:Na+/H+ antiporter NhaA
MTTSSQPNPTKIERSLAPLTRFLHRETSAGLTMILFMIIALIWANSSYHESYEAFLHLPISFTLGSWGVEHSLAHWVNDGLMTIFFFLIGLEIKKEFLAGEISSKDKALLPIIAALGGMAVPALVYLGFNLDTPYANGWAIPTATDIAFTMGAISLLGSRAPLSLKVFLTALAIADDMEAILIIALFYGSDIHFLPLLCGIFVLGFLFWGNRLEIRSPLFYLTFTFLLWVFIFQSGLHATLAGVIAALAVPFRAYLPEKDFLKVAGAQLSRYEKSYLAANPNDPYHSLMDPESTESLSALQFSCTYAEPPLNRLIKLLHLWVSFLIVPLFTLCNAGIRIDASALQQSLTDTVTLGVAFGLAFGKPIGIFGICFISSKLGLVKIADDISWRHIFGAGCLAGIGFTMSLFVTNLSFPTLPMQLNDAKIGILAGSFFAVFVGLFILFRTDKTNLD